MEWTTQMLLVISKMLKNMRQFKSNEDSESLKNLAEECIDILNVHSCLLEPVSSRLAEIMITLEKMTLQVEDVICKSKNRRELFQ